MTMQTGVDVARELLALRREIRKLRQQLDGMKVGVTGRELLSHGLLVVRLGAVRTDTAGVKPGTTNYYVSGATIIEQVFSGVAWRNQTLS